ncbi:MAG: MFS transporter [Puniceicoccales bacterium]|jgi:MFS family permease|nr:MFS transporter [Puniceicoccales bacterium]
MFQGTLDAAFLSLCLLVAIRVFKAHNFTKSIMMAFVWVGGLLAPLLTRLAARTNFRAAYIGTMLFCFAACCFVGAAFAQTFPLVLFFIAAASIFYRAEGAVLISIYVDNYSANQRASRAALGLTLSALFAVIFGHACGHILDIDLSYYRFLFLFVALSACMSGLCLTGIPTSPVRRPENRNVSYISYLFRDKLFGLLTLYFTAIGFVYQMLIPVRMEFLANECYGLNLTNGMVMLLSCVVPNVARVLSIQIIGFLFDRISLVSIRLLVNLIFFIGVVAFFNGHSFFALTVGSIFLGIAMAGSFVLHGLWMTKFAPKEMLPAYASVYMLATGIRSVFAPIVGYILLSANYSPTFVGNASALVIILASIGFWSLRRDPALH